MNYNQILEIIAKLHYVSIQFELEFTLNEKSLNENDEHQNYMKGAELNIQMHIILAFVEFQQAVVYDRDVERVEIKEPTLKSQRC